MDGNGNGIGVGLIGAGHMGREWAKVVAAHPDFDLKGVISRTGNGAASLAKDHGIEVLDSVDRLHELVGDSVVIVAVPELALPEVFSSCKKFDWQLIVEKPAGINFEVAQNLAASASSREAGSFVAFNRRFYSATERLMAALGSEDCGMNILLVDQHDPVRAFQAGQPKEVVESWHYANAIHTVDLLRFVGKGKARVVRSSKKELGGDAFVVDAEIGFDSGDTAYYKSFWNCPGPWYLACFTESKFYELRPLESFSSMASGSRASEPMSKSLVDTNFKPGLWRMLDEMRSWVRSRETNLPDFNDSLESMALVRDIYSVAQLSIVGAR